VRVIESNGKDFISDLHVWRVGPNHVAAIISVASAEQKTPAHYKKLLMQQLDFAHVTIEVNDNTKEK
jgi:Co/Zn/Cd efflux system component